MTFIELETNDGAQVIVNANKIIAITPDDETSGTAVKLEDTILYVKQTPDVIIEKIRG